MQVEEIENMAICYPGIFDPGHLSIHLHPCNWVFRGHCYAGLASRLSVGNGLENVRMNDLCLASSVDHDLKGGGTLLIIALKHLV